jgi:hypothetical protein
MYSIFLEKGFIRCVTFDNHLNLKIILIKIKIKPICGSSNMKETFQLLECVGEDP